MPSRITSLVAAACVLLAGCATEAASKRSKPQAVRSDAAAEAYVYGRRDDVMRFAAEAAERNGLDRAWVEEQLAQARFQPQVAKLVMPPAAGTAKNWAAYRARFVEPQRIAAGLAFWQANEAALVRAEERYGVPAALVVGIVGVESYYGRFTGGFKVVDALATLSFDFPTGRSDRSVYFRGELEQLLRWCHQEGRDVQSVKGSYAGAIGLPQFMPRSVLDYAVDFDGDGRIDLADSPTDVVGSVAHYLAAFGWQRGMPTHYGVAAPVDVTQRALMLVPDIVPSFTAEQFAEHGAVLDARGQAHEGPLALVELQNGDAAPSYVAGTQNFYVVTRYNWSSYYALAVIELGAAIERARKR